MSYSKKIHKLLGIASFLIILVAAVIIIAQVRNLSFDYKNIDISYTALYILIGIIILVGILNLFLIISLTTEKIYKEEYTQKTYLRDIYNIEQEKSSSEEKEGEETIDIEPIAEKILPKENKKTDLNKFCELILINIAKEFDIVQGLFYIQEKDSNNFTICNKYAYYGEEEPPDFELGKTLPGQTAKNQKILNLTKIPENYVTILSGLGSSSPNSLIMIPIVHENKTIGLIELASFKDFDKKTEKIFNELANRIGSRLSTKIT
jgi:putative methionine-R-sulfoxide reductase with GAF domain